MHFHSSRENNPLFAIEMMEHSHFGTDVVVASVMF